ncbi:hypothetical protein [Helicobacter sp. 11S02629-2]|uniref:hypothetical protein n=1 Tax=Helicobacter sp. 11S02629-2 TaxID=1476195 RepID=UPI000BA664B4|nr:hypothetical protein [Helicobacter sp. 11S02629-2]PAF45599.1 hypothetical protein BKH40_01585 [Helicobacter sp. 11S02629-2]
MKKVTKTLIASSLILVLGTTSAFAAEAGANTNKINGLKVFAGVGVGAGISAKEVDNGVRFSGTGTNAKLKLGAGVFSSLEGATLGLQASVGVGVNTLNSSLTPQYMVNLDFIHLFDVGSGFVKLGYTAGVGLAIRTNDVVNSGSGNFNSQSTSASRANSAFAISAAQARSNANALMFAIYQASDNTNSARDAQVQANSNLINATLTWSAKQGDLNRANDAINSASSNVANILSNITSTNSQLSNLNNQLNQAISDKNNAQSMVNSANNALNSLPRPQAPNTSALQAAVNNAQNAVNNAQNEVNNAQSAYSRALSINNQPTYYPPSSSCSGYANFCNSRTLAPGYYAGLNANSTANALADAKAKLRNAQDTLANAQKALSNTQNTYLSQLNAYNNNPAHTTLTNAQNALNDANNKIQNIGNEVSRTQQEANQANQNLINAQKEYNDALTNKNNLAQGQQDYDKAKKAKDAADKALQAATDNLNKLIAQYTANQRIINAAQNSANEEKKPETAAPAPTILPTVKVGLMAFIGINQSVSLEYQYYFRNNTPGLASSDVTLNYAYYF